MTSATGLGLPHLPDELWIQVFSHLLVADRKNIRLTCRRFCRSSNCVDLQKDEQIVFNTKIHDAKKLKLFKTGFGDRTFLNIKLISASLKIDPFRHFFHRQGAQVRSLIIMDCKIAPGLLKSIIKYCEHLCTLTLAFHYKGQKCTQLNVILNDLRALQNSAIIRPSVNNFTLHVMNFDKFNRRIFNYFIFSDKRFFNISATFPNINKLDLILDIDFGEEWKELYPILKRIEHTGIIEIKPGITANTPRVRYLRVRL